MHQYVLGADQVENSPSEKDLLVLVDLKLAMGHQCNVGA